MVAFASMERHLPVYLFGHRVAEVQDEGDAVGTTLTFGEPIYSVEIYHNEAAPQEFVVNGITLLVASGGWRSPVAGTPSDEVEIPGGVDCIVTRLI